MLLNYSEFSSPLIVTGRMPQSLKYMVGCATVPTGLVRLMGRKASQQFVKMNFIN